MSSSAKRAVVSLLLVGALVAPPAGSTVFYSRSEAVDLAFPGADRVESHTYVLTDEQAARVQQIARTPLESRLVRLYRGYANGEVTGYAVIDTHNVRTMPEAFMVVLTPGGEVRSLQVLAFHEPLDYLPGERWYNQFAGTSTAAPLRLGGDIHGVAGATLSARATTHGVRRALAFYEVLVKNG